MKVREGWVTVLMAAYNRAAFLERSVESCFHQEYSKVEVVVVDDGSRDGTPEVLKKLQNRWGSERLRVLRNNENLGTCAALNRALDERSGEYFQFLDSDDCLHPSKIKKQIEVLERSGRSIALCGFRFVDHATGKVLRTDLNEGCIKRRLASFRGINNAAPLMRRAGLPEGLKFNEKFKFHTDIDFFFRLFLSVREWDYCPETWVDYFQHDGTVSRQRQSAEIPYEDYWKEASCYRRAFPYAVLDENLWMMRRLAFSLAKLALSRKRYEEAKRLVKASRAETGTFFQKGGCDLFLGWIFLRRLWGRVKRTAVFTESLFVRSGRKDCERTK